MLLYILLVADDRGIAQDVSGRGGGAGVRFEAVKVLDALTGGPPLFLWREGHHWVLYLGGQQQQQQTQSTSAWNRCAHSPGKPIFSKVQVNDNKWEIKAVCWSCFSLWCWNGWRILKSASFFNFCVCLDLVSEHLQSILFWILFLFCLQWTSADPVPLVLMCLSLIHMALSVMGTGCHSYPF